MRTIRAVTCGFARLSSVFLFVAMVTPGWIDMRLGKEFDMKLSIFYVTVCFREIVCKTVSTVDAATNSEHSSVSYLDFNEYIAECLASVCTCAIAAGMVLCTLRGRFISRSSLISAALLFLISGIMTFVLAGRMITVNMLLKDLFTASSVFHSNEMKTPYSVILEFIGGTLLLLAMISSFIWAYQTEPQHPLPVILPSPGFTHVQVSTGQQMMVPIHQTPVQNVPYAQFT